MSASKDVDHALVERITNALAGETPTRRQLQALCKKVGIRANQKNAAMFEQLEDWLDALETMTSVTASPQSPLTVTRCPNTPKAWLLPPGNVC